MFLRDSRAIPPMVLNQRVCGQNVASGTVDTGKCGLQPGQPFKSPEVSIHRPWTWTLSLRSAKTIGLTSPHICGKASTSSRPRLERKFQLRTPRLSSSRNWCPSVGTRTRSPRDLSTESSHERDAPWEM